MIEGVDGVDPELWNRIIDKLDRTIREGRDRIPIPTAVLTMRAQDLAEVPAKTWQLLKDGLGLEKDRIEQQYGERRLDWKPFGGATALERILQDACDHINNQEAVSTPYQIDALGEDFFEDIQPAEEGLARMKDADVAVVVVDPLAWHLVSRYWSLLRPCIHKEGCATLVLPPIPPSKQRPVSEASSGKSAFPTLTPISNPLYPRKSEFPVTALSRSSTIMKCTGSCAPLLEKA